jgi:predicted nucleic acid-binding protein
LVVSDTSPIRALHHLNQLALLETLFGEVVVPPAVVDELAHPKPRFQPIPITALAFARVQAPSDPRDVQQLKHTLEAGEAEAIALAKELHAELLIDEASGRAEAQKQGLRIVGVLGVLVRAKARGHLTAVLPLAERLRTDLGFFISDDLLTRIRALSGE